MYPKDSYRRLLNLMRTGQLDINIIQPRVFALEALREAMEAAATASNLVTLNALSLRITSEFNASRAPRCARVAWAVGQFCGGLVPAG